MPYAASDLTAGRHTLTVTVTGRKNAASSAATVAVDAIDVPAANQPVSAGDRHAFLSVDGAAPVRISFPTTGGTKAVNVAVARVHLTGGSRGNSLRFTNPDGPAPVIDTVAVPQPAR